MSGPTPLSEGPCGATVERPSRRGIVEPVDARGCELEAQLATLREAAREVIEARSCMGTVSLGSPASPLGILLDKIGRLEAVLDAARKEPNVE